MKKILQFLSTHGLLIAWIVAMLGFTMSVSIGEIYGFTPCFLCWYQRMALFPLVVILGIAAYRGDKSVTLYAQVFCVLGMIVALYHSFLPLFPFLQRLSLCKMGVSCLYEGWLTLLPLMSFLGFVSIFGLLKLSQKK